MVISVYQLQDMRQRKSKPGREHKDKFASRFCLTALHGDDAAVAPAGSLVNIF